MHQPTNQQEEDVEMSPGFELGAMAGLAGKKALELLVEDLYKSGKEEAQKALRNWRTNRAVAKLYTRIAQVRQVKTLWQVDKAVDLGSFYCESHVQLDGQRTRISALSDFKTNENLLIEGIAGQGKSIFLRYLCAVELVRGKVFPVFIELRRIQPNQTLVQGILMGFRELGIELTEAAFRELAATGKVVLFLDAFDEVHEDLRSRMITEIEHLAVTHDGLRLVVSSRMDTGLAMCPKLHVCRLSHLAGGEYQKVVYKLLDDSAIAKQLIDQVEKHPGGLKGLLTTPLMVTLLVLGYKSYQELPAQLSDFYDALFQALLQRHDGVKPGFKRARGCRMNDFQYRQVFEAFCFYVKQAKSPHLNEKEVYATAQQALADTRIKEDPAKFISDIIKITCLLVKDGAEHRFIHKSVQEFYAAAFIASKPDVVVKGIYEKLFSDRGAMTWQQEIRFLSEIDPYRYNKYGLIPALSALLRISEAELGQVSGLSPSPRVREIVLAAYAGFSAKTYEARYWSLGGSYPNPLADLLADHLFFRSGWDLQCVTASLAAGGSTLTKEKKPEMFPGPTGEECLQITLGEIVQAGFLVKEVDQVVKELTTGIANMATRACAFVAQEEQQETMLKLIG